MITSFLYREGKPLQTGLSRSEMLAALADKECIF